jgi:hypothetical protein
MTVRRNRALDRCLRYVTKCLARSCRTLQLRNGGASIWPLYNDMLHSLSTLMLALLSVVVAVADQQCSMSAKWFQKELKLPAYRRGCHLITNKVLHAFRMGRDHHTAAHSTALQVLEQISGDMSQISTGLCHVFSKSCLPRCYNLNTGSCFSTLTRALSCCSSAHFCLPDHQRGRQDCSTHAHCCPTC